MNQELKQQAHKEFMNEFREDIYKTVPTDMDVKIEKVKSFIDSLIDKTVQMTNEKWRKEIIGLMRLSKTEWESMEDLVAELSLITNKSDINKGEEHYN